MKEENLYGIGVHLEDLFLLKFTRVHDNRLLTSTKPRS